MRQLPTCPPEWLSYAVSLACLENDDTARSAFAALLRFADTDVESVALDLHPRLRCVAAFGIGT
eukprot:50659-Eustigmatos_ZCMA.PRE.1